MCENCNSTEKLFYYSEEHPNLPFLNLGNGAYFNDLIYKIDSVIGSEYPFKFSGYNMPYLKNKYTINTMKQFAESLSIETANLNNKVNTSVNTVNVNKTDVAALKLRVDALEIPAINDTAFAGFTTSSSLKEVLQKLSDRIAEIANPQINPSLVGVSSTTVLITTGGALNHTIGASVKVSGASGNNIQIKSDGLFVPTNNVSIPSPQTLSLNGGVLSISGGNYVNLPTPVLSLSGTTLSIGESSVDIGNVANISQTPLTVQNSSTIIFTANGINNHTLTGAVKISTNANNQLTNANGLYVAPTSTATILSDINLVPTYRTLFNDLVKASNIPLTFFVMNTGGSSVTVNYLDVNNISVVRTLLSAESALLQNVKQIITLPTNSLKIDFLGFSN